MWNKSKDLNVLLALDHLEPEKATKNFLNNFFKDLVPYDNIFFIYFVLSHLKHNKSLTVYYGFLWRNIVRFLYWTSSSSKWSTPPARTTDTTPEYMNYYNYIPVQTSTSMKGVHYSNIQTILILLYKIN